MDLEASLLQNKSQNFVVNIFEVTTFSTKHIFDEMSCIGFTEQTILSRVTTGVLHSIQA